MTPINTVLHSKQTMEFPKETQDRKAAISVQRRQHPQPQSARAVPTTPAPAIDPQLTAIAQSTGAPGVYHNPMNPEHTRTAYNPQQDPMRMAIGPGPQAGGRPAPEWYQSPRPTAANVDAPMIKNPMPGFVMPMADANGTSVALPSRFAYYPFKDVYVVPFKNGHLAKLQRAHTEQSLQPIVEVVSTVLYTSTPGYTNLAFQLTMPDFFFVLYWLRLNSFTKTSFIHKTECENPEHIQQVKEGKMAQDTLLIKKIVDKTTLATTELEEIPDPEIFNFGEESDIDFNPPRMRDVLEFLESPLMLDANTRTEFAYLAQQAAHVQGRDEYMPLQERIDIIENLDLDQVHLLKQYEKIMKSYGVEESLNVTCKVCGASRKSNLSLDASSFLSFD